MSIKKVVLAGATGSLGSPVLKALLDGGFEVTAFTRASSSSTFPDSVKVAKVDYDDTASLTKALEGHDALVSTISTGAQDQQFKMIDAAVAAGIKRIIPSEFGSATTNPKAAGLGVFRDKVAVQKHILERIKGTQTTYTLLQNNAFLDWTIQHKMLIDVPGKKMTLFDGGDNLFSTTRLATVAKAVVAVLKHPDETANRVVKVQDTAITQKQLLAIAQRVVGSDGWTIDEGSTAEKEKWANEQAAQGNVDMGVIVAWLYRAIYGAGYGGHFVENDNKLLGIEEIGDKEIEDVIRSVA